MRSLLEHLPHPFCVEMGNGHPLVRRNINMVVD